MATFKNVQMTRYFKRYIRPIVNATTEATGGLQVSALPRVSPWLQCEHSGIDHYGLGICGDYNADAGAIGDPPFYWAVKAKVYIQCRYQR